MQCTATYRALDSKGIMYTVVDLEAEPQETVDQFIDPMDPPGERSPPTAWRPRTPASRLRF